ncbi:MAG: salicylate 1-monooxygenase [Actinomycetales bacterium]|nr:MAG: salicylate 1-monooxygenase [Actinomycetales bacterium]
MKLGHGPRVAVVGGGIGGMAAAAFLHRAGIAVTVFEQARELGEVGAGVVVAPNAVRLLRRLGGGGRLQDLGVRMEVGWEFRRWQDGRVISAEDLDEACERLYGEHTYTMHRADLLDTVRAAVPEEVVRLGARCVGVAQGATGATLTFADGSQDRADLVVGADGVHSVVRGTVTEPSPPEYSGLCAYRALVPVEDAPELARRRAHTLWIGPDHHLVHYLVSGGRLVNLVAFAPAGHHSKESWSATATLDELRAEFEGWDPRLTDLVDAAGTPGRWALLDRAPLVRWGTGRVTLLGDAAHPMFPFYAQGAAQALEDAATLARCLAADIQHPERALRRYEEVRSPRTARVQAASRARAHVNHLPDGPDQRARDEELSAADPLVSSGWIYGHDPEAAFVDAR